MVDFISQLPDDVLVSIIGRTRTEEAVRTSILSKRWRNLYKFVPNIILVCHDLVEHFDSYPNQDLDHSKVFFEVYRFLQLHSGSIRSSHCICCLTNSSAQIFEQCIYSLGKLGIKKLSLLLSCKGKHSDISFPCRLLSHMPALEDFELGLCSLQPNLEIQCNSLKTLTLSRVRALPGSLECILSNCLNLYILTIEDCEFSSSKLCFCGPNLQLKCLMINGCEGVKEIEFYAGNLITFGFFNPQLVNFIFKHVPQLQNISLSLSKENVMSYVCGRLGKDLPKLKSLVVDIKGGPYQDSSILLWTEMFSCLKRLELNLGWAHEINLLSLTPLLHSCPLLQEFHLDVAYRLKDNGPQEEKPVVFHTQLKNVEISGFCGTKNEMNFVLYILRSAMGLEEMYISRHASIYVGFGNWGLQGRPAWSEEMYKYIQEQLKNQAVSKTTQVIIQEFPRMKWKTFTDYGVLVD